MGLSLFENGPVNRTDSQSGNFCFDSERQVSSLSKEIQSTFFIDLPLFTLSNTVTAIKF